MRLYAILERIRPFYIMPTLILVHMCFFCFQAKAFVADPSAFAAMVPAAAGGETEAKEEVKEEAKKQESESESDDDMGFGLFD